MVGQKQNVPGDIQKPFRDAGFEIAETSPPAGSFAVKKYNCVLYLQNAANQQLATPVGPPLLHRPRTGV